MNITMETDYGRIRLQWEEKEESSYRVILEEVTEAGEHLDVLSWESDYASCYAEDRVAYYCQEHGFPYRIAFRAEALQGEEVTAVGQTDTVDPREFFPEQEVLSIGSDIPLEKISGFYWNTSGPSLEMNQRLDFDKTEDGYVLSGVYYNEQGREVNVARKCTEADWNELLQLLPQGRLERSYVMDPEIEMLDGSENELKLLWEDMSEVQQKYYSYRTEDPEALQNWLKEKGKGDGFSLKAILPGIALGALALGGAIWKLKQK